MNRRSFLLAGAALGLTAPFINRAAAQAVVEITATHCWPGHDKFHLPIVEAFMAANPGIKVTYTNSPPNYEEGHQLTLRQALTNQLPDIYFSGFHLLPQLARQLAKRGQITALDDFIAAEGADWVKANYSDRILALGEVDGKKYGMAFNTSTPIVYFNADLVAKAGGNPDAFPTDWDGIISMAAKIRALGDDIDGMFQGVHTGTDDWMWQALVFNQGGDLMDPTDTKVAFGGAEGLAGLTNARRFVSEGRMELRELQTGTQQFYAGKTGIIFQSTASLKATTDSVGSNFVLRTSKHPIAVPGKGGLPTGGNAAIITAKDEAKQKAAWEYVKWVSGPEAQTIAVQGSGYMPVNLRTTEPQFMGEHYAKFPNWQTSLTQIPVARKWYGYPGTNAAKIIKSQKELIGLAMRGDLPVADALAKMVEQTQALVPQVP